MGNPIKIGGLEDNDSTQLGPSTCLIWCLFELIRCNALARWVEILALLQAMAATPTLDTVRGPTNGIIFGPCPDQSLPYLRCSLGGDLAERKNSCGKTATGGFSAAGESSSCHCDWVPE